MTYAEYSLIYLKVVELGTVDLFDFEMRMWSHHPHAPQIYNGRINRSSSLHYAQKIFYVIYHEIGQLGTWNVADQLNLSDIGHE